MKKLIVAVFIIQIMMIGIWGLTSSGVSTADAIKIDKETGLVIKQDTPENLVSSYYDLLSLQQYEKVRALMSPASRKVVDAKSMADIIKRTKMKDATIEKIFPAAVNNDLAVIGYVRSATITNKVFMVGLAIAKIGDKRWEKIEVTDELDIDQVEKVLKLAVKVEGEMLKTGSNGYEITGLTDEYKNMITSQLQSMEASHKQSLIQLQEFKKQQKQTPQAPENSNPKTAPKK